MKRKTVPVLPCLYKTFLVTRKQKLSLHLKYSPDDRVRVESNSSSNSLRVPVWPAGSVVMSSKVHYVVHSDLSFEISISRNWFTCTLDNFLFGFRKLSR